MEDVAVHGSFESALKMTDALAKIFLTVGVAEKYVQAVSVSARVERFSGAERLT